MNKKKKILIITFTAPYPATDGGKISIFGTVSYLRNFYDIKLIYPCSEQALIHNAELQQIWDNVELLPFTRKSAGRLNLFWRGAGYLLTKLKGLKTIFQKPLLIDKEAYEFHFSPLDKDYVLHVMNILELYKFDLIQVEYTKYLSLIEILPKNIKRVFVQIENRYSLLEDYFKTTKSNIYSNYIVNYNFLFEITLMSRFDYIFTLNQEDKRQLDLFLSEEKVFYSPFPILDSHINKAEYTQNSSHLNKLVFLGSESHYPNKDAVQWFAEDILPKLPEYDFYVTGIWSKEFMDKHRNVKFTGFVEDLKDLLKDGILVCPVRIGGGGIRAKVLQAMAMKVPVVSTTLGCFGITNMREGERTVLLADNVFDLVKSINEVASSNEIRNIVVENAFKLILENYTEKVVGEVRRNLYDRILQ